MNADRKITKKLAVPTTVILFVFLVVMVAGFCIADKDFYSIYNVKSMLTNIAFIAIAAGALTLVMITGGLDISIGGNIALTTCVVACLNDMPNHPSAAVIIIAALLLGAAIGTFNGLLITLLDLNPIITTLGTMAVTRGLAYLLTHGRSVPVEDYTIWFIGGGEVWGIPVALLLCAVIYVGLWVLLGKSAFGRKVYYIGANADAARLSGIKVKRVKFCLYLLSGIAASISGLLLAGQLSAGMPQNADGAELEVITAILLGGTSLYGGKGSVWGTLAGVLILGVLFNGLTMVGLSVHVKIFQGIILVIIVALYEIRQKRRY
jgi:ribose/xylose/arabinose/galactoside ABC-type transport system permease subunit